VIVIMQDLKANGLGVRLIAKHLMDEGIPARTSDKWHPSSIRRILIRVAAAS
jgi:hypothetical protein